MAEDEYATVTKSRLKLKDDSGVKKKKKKKDHKRHEQVSKVVEAESNNKQAKPAKPQLQRTKAELAFQKMQEKMQKERIAQKASMTHKERVEKFNQHLDSLTEHFDIPKVSWTK